MGGTDTYSGKTGEYFKTKLEAESKAAAYKRDYGNGVSSKIIIYNGMKKKMYMEKESYDGKMGRWEVDPIDIPPGKWMACLHVKRNGAAMGSGGS